MIIYFSPQCLEYGQRGHPESAERVENTHQLLVSKNYEIRTPQPCHETDLLLAHDREHIDRVKNGTLHDPDTPFHPTAHDGSRQLEKQHRRNLIDVLKRVEPLISYVVSLFQIHHR